MILAAGAVGYVLGTKAGRERYDQISRQAQKIRNNPKVQQKVDEARHVAKDAAGTASQKVKEHRSEPTGSPSSPADGVGTTSFGRSDQGI